MNDRLDHRLARRLRRQNYAEAAAPGVVENHEPAPHSHPHAAHESVHTKELKRHQELAARLQDQMLRTQAEFENYRKRTRRDQQQQVEQANKDLLESLLPMLDNFGRALANPGNSIEGLLAGLEMVHKQALDLLALAGLERIEALGQPFDPNLHEAVGTAEAGEVPDNHVADVLQDGYMLKGRLLRPAMVRVARG